MDTKPTVKKVVHLTVGELVVAAMDAALELSRNQRKARRLAGIVLNKLLSESRLGAGTSDIGASKKPLFH